MVIKNLENKVKLVTIICSLFLVGCVLISISSIWTAKNMDIVAYSHNVGKFGIAQPLVLHHNLVVNERKHGVTATKIECPYLRKDNKQF